VRISLNCIPAALLILFGLAPLTTSIHAQSTYVYTNNNSIPNTVSAFSVGPGGILVPLGPPKSTGGDGFGSFSASNTATATIRRKFLYVSNNGTSNISGFSIDTTTGVLTSVPGSPFPAGGSGGFGGISLAVTPNGRFLYAGNSGSNNISAFGIGPDGALTALTSIGSPFPLGDSPDGIKASPNGKFLGVALPFSNRVAMLRIDSNGALDSIPGSPFSQGGMGNFASYVDMSCKSQQLFAALANFGTTDVGVSTIDSDGALNPIGGSPFTFVGGMNSSVGVLSPNNQWLFISNQNSSTITSLDVESDGSLAQVGGSPFADSTALMPNGMATNREGTFLYVANGDNSVTGFAINNSNGALSPVGLGSPFLTGVNGSLRSLTVFPANAVEGDGGEKGDDGHEGRFNFHAERECKASGGMEFQEPDTGEKMTGSADAVTVTESTAVISGSGTLLDGTPLTYTAVVLGNAPVIGLNQFAISWITSTGSVFHTSGALTDGYIVVHQQ
jgi:6-phosphogluconolactonase (cycloisomerase 2 family)